MPYSRFYCLTCGYSDSCVGHRWEDGTPLAKFTSFACKDCKRLCDNSYLKGVPDMSATMWKPTWEYVPDEPFCMGAVQRMSRSGAKIIRYVLNVEE